MSVIIKIRHKQGREDIPCAERSHARSRVEEYIHRGVWIFGKNEDETDYYIPPHSIVDIFIEKKEG